MAAPHLPENHDSEAERARREAERSARIADLAARMASVDPTTPAKAAPDAGHDDGSNRSAIRPARAARDGSGRPTRPSSGPAGQLAGGHPEDDPGDPETVARAICLRLLATAARPRAGLAQALRRKGIPGDVADRVLDRLTEVGLIDDQAYAAAFVETKHRDRGLGAAALRTELRRKGVDAEIAGNAAAQVDSEAERRRAHALIARRVDAAMASGYPAARRRLVGLLARRGYSADVAVSVVDAALTDYRDEEDA